MSSNEESNNLLEAQSNYLLEKLSTVQSASDYNYLTNDIPKIQNKLSGRVVCSFSFKNNLITSTKGSKAVIKYLKLGHVLVGQEAFVYERVNINPGTTQHFNRYVIGTSLGSQKKTKEEVAVGTKSVKTDEKRDAENIYDKLYIQFVIEKKINGVMKEIVYNQCYEQFLKEELFDIFAVTGNLTDDVLELMNIQLYFDTKFNEIEDNGEPDDLKLRLAVTMPTGYIIDTTNVIL